MAPSAIRSFHRQHKATIGFGNTIAVVRRAHLAHSPCPASGLAPLQSTLSPLHHVDPLKAGWQNEDSDHAAKSWVLPSL